MNPKQMQDLFEQQANDPNCQYSDEEKERMRRSFQNPEFVKMFNEFAKELDTEKGKENIEKTIRDMENYSKAQAFVDQEKEKTQKVEAKEPKGQYTRPKQDLTYAEKKQLQKQEKGAKIIEHQLEQEELKKKEELAKLKQFEEMYKRNLQGKAAQPQASESAQQNPQLQPKTEQFDPKKNVDPISGEDMRKLNELLQSVENLKKECDFKEEKQKEDKIIEELTGVNPGKEKPIINLPYKLVYKQDMQFADYIQEEQLNINQIRGYKSIQFIIPIPNNANKESMKLEVEKQSVKYKCEDEKNNYYMERQLKYELKQKESVAKLRNFSQQETEKIGYKQYLEVNIPINHDGEQSIKFYMEEMKKVSHIEEGDVKQKTEEEIQQDMQQISEKIIQEQKPSIQVPESLQQEASKWKASEDEREGYEEEAPKKLVEIVEQKKTFEDILKEGMEKKRLDQSKLEEEKESQKKTFEDILKEGMEKKRKVIDLNKIEEGLPDVPTVGVSFIFRGKTFPLCNPDLTDMITFK